MLLNIPNLITIGRIAVIPILMLLMQGILGADIGRDKSLSFWAMIVFTIAAVSDLADGYYARRYGQVSTAGKFFDPMADKLIHMTAMVYLVSLGRLSAWVAVVLLFREIFINGLRTIAAGEGLIIDAAEWGKKKTAWLNVGIGALILHHTVFPGTFLELDTVAVGRVCVVAGFIYSVASAVQYTFVFIRRVRGT